MNGDESYILSRKYTEDTIHGAGAVRGKSPIPSHENVTGGVKVKFTVVDDVGHTHEDEFTLLNGAKGDPGDDYVLTSQDKSEIADIVIEEVPAVEANPTLVGTEPDLTGLKVGNAKYKVPTGGSGTQVNANPVLVGTEDDLSSIEIGNTKYKVSVNKGISESDYEDLPSSKNSDDIAYFVEDESNDYAPQVISVTRTVNKEEVYVGTSQPNANSGYKVWVNPNETPSSGSGGSSGTNVVANPTLLGNESALEGLTVGTTSYKVAKGLTLLWENTITPANKTNDSSYPYSEFTLDVTGYKYVVVDYIFYSHYNNIITAIHPVGQSSRVYYVAWNQEDVSLPQTGAVIFDRIVVANKTGTTFKFYDCSINGETNNKGLIPWRIWGMN